MIKFTMRQESAALMNFSSTWELFKTEYKPRSCRTKIGSAHAHVALSQINEGLRVGRSN